MPQSLESQRTDTVALALWELIRAWPEWCFRRVDSVHPLEGTRGRQKHSIDCCPPVDPRLAYGRQRERMLAASISGGLTMVPLAFLQKGPLRHFDAMVDGASIPVLGVSEASALSSAMIAVGLARAGVELDGRMREAVDYIVGPLGNTLRDDEIRELLQDGQWMGRQVFPASSFADAQLARLVTDLSKNFLLIGLLSTSTIGRRQVIKFSFNWEVDASHQRGSALARMVLGGGLSELEITMIMPEGARSYHLEFQTPHELECRMLSLPERGLGEEDEAAVSSVDVTRNPVAHVHGTYSEPPPDPALVVLALPFQGLRAVAIASVFTTTAIVALALLLPGAKGALLSASDGAAALLLAIPAAFIGYLAASRESTLVSATHRPIRGFVLVSSWSLLARAGSVVGYLHQPWLDALWWVCLFVNLTMLALMLAPRAVAWSARIVSKVMGGSSPERRGVG